ncbi:MAG TPA: SNF2-related protein, partial [Anaeromyxobacteraceae bacterium]|nr:SNF2-related protein [Anaeromyxobacteraceae bacterium]
MPPSRAPTLVDHLSASSLEATFAEDALGAGREAVTGGRVSRPALRASSAEAVVVAADRRRHRARLRLVRGALDPSCTCGDRGCAHAAALGLLLVGDEASGRADEETDSPTLRDAELRRREARGSSELFEIRRLGGAQLVGRYEVTSPSARAYQVTLRALDARHNGCSCADFATNQLGTCKHVEAVLHHLRRDAPRRVQRALSAGPAASYLHLVFEPESIGLRLAVEARPPLRRIAARFFDAAGRLRGDLARLWPDLERAALEAGIEVPAEVVQLASRALAAERESERRREVEAEVRIAGRDQPGLRVKLYPYQVDGVAFLASRGRALLADEMGLGKTVQAIAALRHLARRGEVARTLIVCPASLKHQWIREIRQFTGMGEDEIALVGGTREQRLARYADAPAVLVTSYELVRADERELAALAPDLLVLDEAQRIKNWRTRTASVVKSLRSRFAFVLTGTPLENRLDDLY